MKAIRMNFIPKMVDLLMTSLFRFAENACSKGFLVNEDVAALQKVAPVLPLLVEQKIVIKRANGTSCLHPCRARHPRQNPNMA